MNDKQIGSLIMEDTGKGEIVVMIHGLGGTSNSFQTLMKSLSGFRVIRPDLPGAGRSSLRPGKPGIDGLVSSIMDCLKSVNIKRAHFVGHSMGTLICQHLVVKFPDLVQSLVLFGPILEPPVAARQALIDRAATARADGMAGIADLVANSSVSDSSCSSNPVTVAFVRESLMRQDANGYAKHCEALSKAQSANHAAINCPTLLIAGENDLVAPVKMAKELKNKIHEAKLEIVPDVGHWMMIEDCERSATLLRAHLDNFSV
jgi:3-oxoadipate enol-lactonase